MADQRVPIDVGQTSAEAGLDRYSKLPEEFTSGESIGAAFDLAYEETLGIMAYKSHELTQIEKMDSRTLSPDEANAEFPMRQPFQKPTTFAIAKYLHMEEQDKLNLEQKIALGPQDFYTKSLAFGAGIVAHMMDPLETAASAGIGGYVGGVMARTAWGARAAGSASLGTRTAFNALEAGAGNLAENVIQEAVTAEMRGEFNQEYSTDEGLTNIIAGTFFGTALGVGIKEGSFRLNNVVRNISPESDLAFVRSILASVIEEKKPDPTPLAKAFVRESDVTPVTHPGQVHYQYIPLTPETAKQKQFYVVSRNAELGNNKIVGHQYFNGSQMTDNPGVANAKAAPSVGEPGVIHMVDPMDLNPIDLDKPVPENVRGAFEEALGVKDLVGATPKQVMDAVWVGIDSGRLKPDAIDTLQTKLKEAGFDSAVHNGTKVADMDHSPHNVVTIFDDTKLKSKGFMDPNPAIRNVPTPEQAHQIAIDREHFSNNLFVDMDELERFKQSALEDSQSRVDPLKEVDEHILELQEEMKILEDQGLLDPQDKADAERILNLDQTHEAELMAIKAAFHCVRK